MSKKTPDMTLAEFLADHMIGYPKDIPVNSLLEAGMDPDVLNETEVIYYDIVGNFEVGELPALAAGYLVRSGYDDVSVKRQHAPGLVQIDGSAEEELFTHGSLIIGLNYNDDENDDDSETLEPVFIQVSYNTKSVIFALSPLPDSEANR